MQLRFIVFKEKDLWVARGLSYDFIGESSTKDGAITNFCLAVAAEYEFAKKDKRKPFEGLPKAQKSFLNWIRSKSNIEINLIQL